MEPIMIHEHHRREGTEVLRVRITLPQWEALPSVNDFYREMGERAAAFCRTCLSERAEAAYEGDPDPKKRFRFRPLRYTLTGTVAQDGERVRVRLCAELVDENGVHSHFRDEQLWEGETMVPPKGNWVGKSS